MSDVAPEFRTPEFERYLAEVTPVVQRIARKRARPHAMLRQDDLVARALEVCLHVWSKLHGKKPHEEVMRITNRAVRWRLTQERLRALRLGEAEAIVVPVDAPAGRLTNVTFGDTLRAPEAPRRAPVRLWPVSRVVVNSPLAPDERVVLEALTCPPPAVVEAALELWGSVEQKQMRWNWSTARVHALARGLGWEADRVRRAYRGVLARVSVEFYRQPPAAAGYEEIGIEIVDNTQQEESDMEEALMDAPEEPQVEAPKGAEKPAKSKPKGAAKKKKQQPADGAKPEKVYAKLKTGDACEYVGGGNAKDLRGGARGVVKRVWPDHKYYGVAFGKDKPKYHVIAGYRVKAV